MNRGREDSDENLSLGWTPPTGDYDSIADLLTDRYPSAGNVGILISKFNHTEGAAIVAKRQTENLLESGYNVKIFCFEAKDSDSFVDHKKIGHNTWPEVINRLIHIGNPVSIYTTARRLRKYDVLIVHQPILSPVAITAQKLFNVHTIYINHHVIEPNGWETSIQRMINRLITMPLHEISARLEEIVSVSAYSRDEFHKKYDRTGPVIYNQVDDEKYHQDVSGKAIRDSYNIGNRPLIFFIGRLIPSKNVHTLIQVYERIREQYPETVLLIAGRALDEGYKSQLVNLQLQNEGDIRFEEEFIPEEVLPEYYAAADVYATCSLKEGFNLTIAEAEMCGTPTVAFNIGAHSEVQSNGTLVPKNDHSRFADAIINEFKEEIDD